MAYSREICEVCGNPRCDGMGIDRDDREFHNGYRTSMRISEARKVYGDKVANEMELEADRQFNYY